MKATSTWSSWASATPRRDLPRSSSRSPCLCSGSVPAPPAATSPATLGASTRCPLAPSSTPRTRAAPAAATRADRPSSSSTASNTWPGSLLMVIGGVPSMGSAPKSTISGPFWATTSSTSKTAPTASMTRATASSIAKTRAAPSTPPVSSPPAPRPNPCAAATSSTATPRRASPYGETTPVSAPTATQAQNKPGRWTWSKASSSRLTSRCPRQGTWISTSSKAPVPPRVAVNTAPKAKASRNTCASPAPPSPSGSWSTPTPGAPRTPCA